MEVNQSSNGVAITIVTADAEFAERASPFAEAAGFVEVTVERDVGLVPPWGVVLIDLCSMELESVAQATAGSELRVVVGYVEDAVLGGLALRAGARQLVLARGGDEGLLCGLASAHEVFRVTRGLLAKAHHGVKSESRDRDVDSLQAIIDASGDAIITFQLSTGRVVACNHAATALLGREPGAFVNSSLQSLAASSDDTELQAAIDKLGAGATTVATRCFIRRANNKEMLVDIRARSLALQHPDRGLWILRPVERVDDVKDQALIELSRAKDQLERSARLASLGQLAAGVAHEINNPANFVKLNLSLIREQCESATDSQAAEILQQDEVRDMLDDCVLGMDRIEGVARELLRFVRVDNDEPGLVNVNEIVEQAIRMLHNQIRHRARLVTDLGEIKPIVGDPGKLLELITNLVLNAAQAISLGSADENQIRVTTRQQSDGILLRVSDTGCGIPERVKSRIFEPFYTTKAKDEGTGLGLALCAEVVRLHRGTVEVDSEESVGTTFSISLPGMPKLGYPRAKATTQVSLEHTAEYVPEEISETQTEDRRMRVLLVDDEELILKAYRRMLEHEYDVVMATTGDAALDTLTTDDDFDAVICDLSLPGLDGDQVYEAIRTTVPRLSSRVIFCSGGILNDDVQGTVSDSNCPLLQKPVSKSTLTGALEALLSSADIGRIAAG